MTDTRDADIEDLQRQIDSLTRRVQRIKPEEDWTLVFIMGSTVIVLLGILALIW